MFKFLVKQHYKFCSPSKTIFDKIINKQLPADIVFEDDDVLAFKDINPQADIHILVIPKVNQGLTRLQKATEEHTTLLGKLLIACNTVAQQQKLQEGYRIVINDGPAGGRIKNTLFIIIQGQTVYHLHMHILGGKLKIFEQKS